MPLGHAVDQAQERLLHQSYHHCPTDPDALHLAEDRQDDRIHLIRESETAGIVFDKKSGILAVITLTERCHKTHRRRWPAQACVWAHPVRRYCAVKQPAHRLRTRRSLLQNSLVEQIVWGSDTKIKHGPLCLLRVP